MAWIVLAKVIAFPFETFFQKNVFRFSPLAALTQELGRVVYSWKG